MTDRDRIELSGVVVDMSKDIFTVDVAEKGKAPNLVRCKLSGKVRTNLVKILVGDKVQIEVSPYDLTQGRIIYRSK